MLYDFQCTACGHIQTAMFSANDYDKYVMEDGRLKRKKCEECKALKLYRHISAGSMPAIMGGTKGYMSMERYWQQNPGLARQREDEIAKAMETRHADRVTSNIDKQKERRGRDERHKGYADGNGEQKLSSD